MNIKTLTWLGAAAAVLGIGPVLIAQASAAPPETVNTAVALGQQSFSSLLLSFFVPRVMEALKNWQRFTLVQEGARRLNRAVAVVVAMAQGSGLTWAYHQSTGDGWQFVLGSRHSSFEEWALACLVAFGAQQFFYEQLPSTQADTIARALSKAIRDAKGDV